MDDRPISLEAAVKLWGVLRFALPLAMIAAAIIVYFVLDFEGNNYLAIAFLAASAFEYFTFTRLWRLALKQLENN